jgi:hypothetical protein
VFPRLEEPSERSSSSAEGKDRRAIRTVFEKLTEQVDPAVGSRRQRVPSTRPESGRSAAGRTVVGIGRTVAVAGGGPRWPGRPRPCGDLAELPMYGILVQSPSFAEAPLGPRGAAGAECSERSESGRPSSPEELHSYFNLILVVFL